MKRILISFLVLAVAFMIAAPAIAAYEQGPVLDRILGSGDLNIGITFEDLPGFMEHENGEEWAPPVRGMEYDYGRAIHAAVNHGRGYIGLEWVQIENYDDRFVYLREDTVDVVLDVATYQNERDVYLLDAGFQFPAIYYYDGTNVVLKAPPGATVNVAVGEETSNYPQLEEYLALHPELSNWNVVPYESDQLAKEAFLTDANIDGYCSDKSNISGFIYSERQAGTAGAENWYVHFPTDIAKSPLASCIKEGDTNWEEIVKWVFFVVLTAEEKGYRKGDAPPLGWTDPTVTGLNPGWSVAVIDAVGNYDQWWTRNMEDPYGDLFNVTELKPPLNASPHAKKKWYTTTDSRGANELWFNGGLFYAAPW